MRSISERDPLGREGAPSWQSPVHSVVVSRRFGIRFSAVRRARYSIGYPGFRVGAVRVSQPLP